MSTNEIRIRRGNDGRWYYAVVDPGNNRIVGDSGQGYASRQGARKAARREHPGASIVVLPDNTPKVLDPWPQDPDSVWGAAEDMHEDRRE